MNIAIFGLGYVGAVSAACLAKLGHHVIGVDRDDRKVNSILAGRPPFYEPGLESLIAETVASGRLTAHLDSTVALESVDVAFVCVGTPSERNGNLGLDQLRRVCESIGVAAATRTLPLTLVIRSTVFPGTCEDIVAPALAGAPAVTIVSNPEFLREGSAVKDFLEPSLLVVGGSDPAAMQTVAGLYASLPVTPCLVSLRTAEMIKYACNAFHAVKISFANEIGSLSEALDIDPLEVMSTLCQDQKLNTSAAYLRPGFAFGGSCLPKDLRALVYRSRRADLSLTMLESILPSNDAHLGRAIQSALDLPASRIGVLGLAFKENTDDLRESPVVSLLEQLLGKGREVKVYDPHICLDNLHGANRHFILHAIPHIGRLLTPDAETVLTWADSLIVAQKPSPQLVELISRSGLPVLDLVKSGFAWPKTTPIPV
jgi:GDP-mannose 6-dehydrogenase